MRPAPDPPSPRPSSVHALMTEALLFLAGAALIAAAVRGWRPDLPVRAAAGYVALTAAFFAAPLFRGALQVPTDIAYQRRPFVETLEQEIQPKNPLLVDVLFEQLPFHTLVRRRLRALEAPLWSHEMGTGQPLLGNAQSAPFAPLHLLALPLPPLRALTVSAAWEILLGLLLMDALARRLGAGGWGAAFAAVAMALSTFIVAWAYHPPAMSSVWIPGVFLGLVLLRHGERGGFAGLVACGLGLVLAGHPESLALTAFAAVPVAAVLCFAAPAGRLAFLGRLAAAALLTFCLAAPALLPFLDALPGSDRMQIIRLRGGEGGHPRFEPRFLLPLFDPLAFGSPRDGTWDGPVNFNEMSSDYAGLLTLVLALAGAVVLRGRVLALVAGGAAALLAALRVAPFYTLLHAIPLLGHTGLSRLRIVWVIAVALAAGLSLERLAAIPERGRGRGRALTLALLAVGGLALAFRPPAAPWERAWWGTALLGAAAALATLALPRLRRAFVPVALAGLACELFLLGVRYQPSLPPSFDLAPPPALAGLVALTQRPGPPFRILAEGGELYPYLAALYGLWDARGEDAMRPFDAASFLRRRLRTGAGREQNLKLAGDALQRSAVDYLSVRFALTGHRRHLPPPWRWAWNDQGGRVWENPEALPLFFLPHRFVRAEAGEALRLTLANLDFGALGVAAGPAVPPMPQEGGTDAIRPRSNGFDLDVRSPTGGTVVSSVSYAPGWQCEVDGRPGAVFEVNSAFLGFAVPPGAHRVRLDYRPAGWRRGLLLCALAVGAVLVSLLVALARTRAAGIASRETEESA